MDATCPCHRVWHRAESFYDHLQAAHAVPHDQAFLMAQLGILGAQIEYVVDHEGDIILMAAQLPLEGTV